MKEKTFDLISNVDCGVISAGWQCKFARELPRTTSLKLTTMLSIRVPAQPPLASQMKIHPILAKHNQVRVI